MSARAASTSSPHELSLRGVQLVEASAGTGKTHAIAVLYLRLLMEAEINVGQIIVLTFTRAAAAELKERIRRAVVSLSAALASGHVEDPVAREVHGHIADPRRAALRLHRALSEFDTAPILTIHGFCQRLLGELAFSASMAFSTEVLTDEGEMLHAIVRDFWRREIYGAGSLFAEYLIHKRCGTPEALLARVKAHPGRRFARIVGGDPADCIAVERTYEELFGQVAEAWRVQSGEIHDLLTRSDALNRNQYPIDSIKNWVAALSAVMQGEVSLRLPKGFERFTPERIGTATKNGHSAPVHRLFNRCADLRHAAQALDACYGRRLAALWLRLLGECERELRSANRRLRLISYRDMLVNVAAALRGAQGAELAARLRERYPAALVDEFQDTDPLQYEILRRIYGEHERPVFLVGDPKQAIFGFRGADVFAYLRARRDVSRVHALTVNRRSEPRLIEAVNAIFSSAPQPFAYDEIAFRRVTPADEPTPPLRIDGKADAPLQIWLLGRNGDSVIAKRAARERIAIAVAGEVARLLMLGAEGRALVPDRHTGSYRGLRGDDVAVLVRKHDQAQRVRAALAAVGVTCVLRTRVSVFATREAEELARVLAAVAEPNRETALHAALASDMLGRSGPQLCALMADERAWQAMSDRFHAWRALWLERGFFVMLHRLMAEEGVAARLLGREDGERRLTNLLHLAELLHAEASGARAGMEQVIQRLGERRHAEGEGADEELLRLESDEQLVQVITVHASKGLEYPIVFCPFEWDTWEARDKSAPIIYHDPADHYASVLHLSEEGRDRATELWRREQLAEQLRLFYVAVTRARQRCVLLWGCMEGAHASAPAWLLHAHRRHGPAEPFARQVFQSLTDMEIHADLTALATRSDGAVTVCDPPSAEVANLATAGAPADLAARRFVGVVRPAWQLSSYSSLLRQRDADDPDHDAGGASGSGPETALPTGIAAFPRGAQAGRCLHAMLERLDFANADPQHLRGVVGAELARHGFDLEWCDVVACALRAVIDADLDGAGLRLSSLSMDQRLNELEFHYPIARVTAEGLNRVLGVSESSIPGGELHGEALHFAPTHGFMKGYIDLIFEARGRYYIVDYKSNWLGADISAYDTPAMAETMEREAYRLQYLLYTVALHRFLKARLAAYDYERHFGGVRYLFLRGIDPADPHRHGIYATRPRQSSVAALDDYLAHGG